MPLGSLEDHLHGMIVFFPPHIGMWLDILCYSPVFYFYFLIILVISILFFHKYRELNTTQWQYVWKFKVSLVFGKSYALLVQMNLIL
jgi:hypothetical protein